MPTSPATASTWSVRGDALFAQGRGEDGEERFDFTLKLEDLP